MKAWRKSLGVSAQDLADAVPCDVTTVFRYESGKLTPDPEAMMRICKVLGDTSKWHHWMATVWPSYREMHPEPAGGSLEGSVMQLYAVIENLVRHREPVFRDAADGNIDSADTLNKLQMATDELLSVAQSLKTKLKE